MPNNLLYNPQGFSCKEDSDFMTGESFSELELGDIIYISKISDAGATLMYCIDPSNFSNDNSDYIPMILKSFFSENTPIPNFNCQDLNLIRLQLNHPSEAVLQIIDTFIGEKCPPEVEVNGKKGPSKGFMLFLRGVICCLKTAQKKSLDLYMEKKDTGADEVTAKDAEDSYRTALMVPLLVQLMNKINSLSEIERKIIANLPFTNPRDLYASGDTLYKYIDYQLKSGHCGGSIIGDLCDFYNYNKKNYFPLDEDIVGVRKLQPCSGKYVNTHCIFSPFSNNTVSMTATANNFKNANYTYHSESNGNINSSISYAKNLRKNNSSNFRNSSN